MTEQEENHLVFSMTLHVIGITRGNTTVGISDIEQDFYDYVPRVKDMISRHKINHEGEVLKTEV
ncbi:hypothetical protein [Enterobacter ludwigii]